VNTVIIPAGGSGTRMGNAAVPKQFADVCGKPVIIHTLLKFNAHSEIDAIIVGCRDDYMETLYNLAEKWDIGKLKNIVCGLDTRQGTVFNCLKTCAANPEDIILIHDAVRPLAGDDIISANIEAAGRYGAVNTIIPMTDTLVKSADGQFTDEIPDRNEFYQVQTPQTFKYEIIMKAHLNAKKNGVTDATDDCRLCMDIGVKVFLTRGSRLNFKITTPEDLTRFEDICLKTTSSGYMKERK